MDACPSTGAKFCAAGGGEGAAAAFLVAVPTPLKMELGEVGDPLNFIYGSIFLFVGKTR